MYAFPVKELEKRESVGNARLRCFSLVSLLPSCMRGREKLEKGLGLRLDYCICMSTEDCRLVVSKAQNLRNAYQNISIHLNKQFYSSNWPITTMPRVFCICNLTTNLQSSVSSSACPLLGGFVRFQCTMYYTYTSAVVNVVFPQNNNTMTSTKRGQSSGVTL